MCQRDEADTQHRQHGFGQAVANGDGSAHQGEPDAADDQRPDASVAQDTVTERDKPHHECQGEADAMYRGRKKRFASQTQDADEEDAENAVHGAQAAQDNAGTVEPVSNRGKSAVHVPADM